MKANRPVLNYGPCDQHRQDLLALVTFKTEDISSHEIQSIASKFQEFIDPDFEQALEFVLRTKLPFHFGRFLKIVMSILERDRFDGPNKMSYVSAVSNCMNMITIRASNINAKHDKIVIYILIYNASNFSPFLNKSCLDQSIGLY